jgi:4-amino-4-deoxy-L-arabinose transferase-like glycosyltransferase
VTWAAALVAAGLVFAATRGIPGISPDSTQYLAAAQSVLAGRGLETYWWREGAEPLTHFPPLYPLAIAAVAATGLAAERAAWLLNLALVPVAILLLFRVAHRASGSARGAAAAAVAVALSPDVLLVHTMVWSEPLFLVLLLASLLAIARAMRRLTTPAIAAAGLSAGAATLVRYPGIVIVGTGVLALLATAGRRGERLARPALFAVVAALPVALWLVRNVLVGATATNRSLAVHPISLEKWRFGLGTVARWIVPALPSRAAQVALFAVAGVALIALALVAAARWGVRRSAPHVTPAPQRAPERRVGWIFIAGYAAFLVLSMTVADALTRFEPRILLPVYVVLVALVVPPAVELIARSPRGLVRLAGGAAVLLIGSTHLVSSIWFARRAHRDGLGYEARYWRQSTVLAAARALPRGVHCFANVPELVRYVAARPCAIIPVRFDPTSRQPNATYEQQARAIRLAAAHQPTVVVFIRGFDGPGGTWYLPSADETTRMLGLRPRMADETGFVADVLPLGDDARDR